MEDRENRDRARLAELRRAYESGALDILMDYLKGRVERHELPQEPSGAEWPYKRAFCDGQLSEAAACYKWLVGRVKKSPDGAENTEG